MKQNKVHREGSPLQGRVIAGLGKAYEVLSDEEIFVCRPRGRMYIEDPDLRPVTGDIVSFFMGKSGEDGWIERTEERRSVLQRRAPETGKRQILAANLDQVVICVAAHSPPFRRGMVDRYIVLCEASKLHPLILLNKCEGYSSSEVHAILSPFQVLGYACFAVSAHTGEGMEAVRRVLQNKHSVLTGPSGVGKSSIVNFFEPSIQLRIGELNAHTQKGKHTTTVARWFPFLGGALIDTPGLRELGLIGVRLEELAWCFREMRPFLGGCRFRDCQHDAEPYCAIKEAVLSGEIQQARYESYLQFRAEIKEEAQKLPYTSELI